MNQDSGLTGTTAQLCRTERSMARATLSGPA
ncbi:Uncharacterised protein [Mycobacteroides abscessus subsp. abscessus]|nr:Uncharacterised protein [Mycobacteroides abscessus subsp. abscessus]